MGETSHYKMLGITKDASTDEIKKAYRKQSLKYHRPRDFSKSQRGVSSVG